MAFDLTKPTSATRISQMAADTRENFRALAQDAMTIGGTKTFTGDIVINKDLPLLDLQRAAALRGRIGIANAANALVSGSAAGDLGITTVAGAKILIGVGGNQHLTIDASGNIGVGGAPSVTKFMVLQVAGTTDAILRLSQLQGANDRGGYMWFGGGSTGSGPRGYIGFGKIGTGQATVFTAELADSFSIRAEGALHLGSGGDNIRVTIDASGITTFFQDTYRSGAEVGYCGNRAKAAAAGDIAEYTVQFRHRRAAVPTISLSGGLTLNCTPAVAGNITVYGFRFQISATAAGDMYSVERTYTTSA